MFYKHFPIWTYFLQMFIKSPVPNTWHTELDQAEIGVSIFSLIEVKFGYKIISAGQDISDN